MIHQFAKKKFCEVWKEQTDQGMSTATLDRQKAWAKENYPDWALVFLLNGLVDIDEYQEMLKAMSVWKRANPVGRITKGRRRA